MTNSIAALAEGTKLPPVAKRKRIRLDAGVSQSELARALNVGRSTLIRWERGDVEPQPDHRRRYAGALQALQGTTDA